MTTLFCLPASAAGDDGIIDFKFNEISLAYYTVRDKNGMVLPTIADSSDNSITISNADLISAPSNNRYVIFSGALNLAAVPAKSNIQLALSIEIGSNTSTWKNGPKWVGRTSQLNGGNILTTGTATFTGNQIISYKIPMSSLEDGTYFFGFELPYFYIDGQIVDFENLKISFVNMSVTTGDGHVYDWSSYDYAQKVEDAENLEKDALLGVAPGIDYAKNQFLGFGEWILGADRIYQGLTAVSYVLNISLDRIPAINDIITFAFIIGLLAFLVNLLPGIISSFKPKPEKNGKNGYKNNNSRKKK